MAAALLNMTKSLPTTLNRSQLARALGYVQPSGHINWVSFYNYLEIAIGDNWKEQLKLSERQHIFNAVQTRKLISLLELNADDF